MRPLGKRHIILAFWCMALLGACGQESETASSTSEAPAASDTPAAGDAMATSDAPDAEASSSSSDTPDENGASVEEIIKARQAQLKKFGGAFKAINDQLKASSPDLAAIQAAAASLPVEAATMADWFPAGSGPESGIETDALAKIWETRADFDQKMADFQAAAANLNTVAQGGDLAAIGAAFGATGGTCKGCHDDYRLDD